ncbi:MAG: YqaA family protein [Terriglobales bacterium]
MAVPPLPRGDWFSAVFYFFIHYGALGVLVLSICDSTFLTLPLAIDLSVIVLSSLHHESAALYALAAAIGSVVGAYVMYWVGRKGGESFIQAHVSERKFQQIHHKVSGHGPWLLALPGLMPPPFPFTIWVIAAGALDVPRDRFLWALAAMRAVRFFVEAVLAVIFGRGIVAWLKTPTFRYLIDFIVAIAILGSAYSIYQLVRTMRRSERRRGGGPRPRAASGEPQPERRRASRDRLQMP